MNNNGITYFRLKSPYPGDVTKDCGLTGSEVDNNFFVLEGRDIKSVTRDGDTLVFTLLNGDVLSVDITAYVEKATFEFDAENGVLMVTQDGETQYVSGFKYDYETRVARDYTLIGDGSMQKPLSISPLFRTSHYRPVKSFIDKVNGQFLPSGDDVKIGDRFLMSYKVNDYGFLYDYRAVRRIACDLANSCSDWRIPSKEDWDDMLNAVEPLECAKNHNNPGCNQYFGKVAGKLLKSPTGWRPDNTSGEEDNTQCGCCDENCGDMSQCECNHDTSGVGLFGFDVMPSGYTDDGGMNGYFGDRASFWTSTCTANGANAYIKRFEYNKSTVYQDILPSTFHISLRLVKEYDGGNFNGKDNILGVTFDTVVMPSQSKGSRIWTATSVAFDPEKYASLLPNNGVDVDPSIKYAIVEWTGNRWVSNQFVEGDVVAITNAPNGEYNAEYKLVHNELIALHEQIVQEVIDSVQDRLDDLERMIEEETAERIESDGAINERLDELNTVIGDVSDRLDAETEAREQKDTEIEGKLIVMDGSEFNSENGILTLKSNDGSNDIAVQFSFNFGTI